MLKFDPNLRWLFTELPMVERYAAAAQAGFKGVEVAFPYDYKASDLNSILKNNGLSLVQILAPFDWDGGERGLGALPGRESEFKTSISSAIEFAIQVGRPMIHIMPGNITSELNKKECLDIFKSNLAWAAEVANREGITLILEPCCAARFPDFLYHRIHEGVDVIKELGCQNIKLCFDTFHVQMEEGAITPKLIEAFPYIGHIQVGNVPGRHEPGNGEIYFPYLFSQIEKLGWDRWIGCEYTPSGPTLETLGWGAAYGIGIPRQA
jgi:hydroxypyruvate isomerase